MKGFGRIGRGIRGLGNRAGSAARKLRNRAGQFAFTGGRKARPGAKQRLANRKARAFGRGAAKKVMGFKKAVNRATDASDRWMGNHPVMASAAIVSAIAGAGYAGTQFGRHVGSKWVSAAMGRGDKKKK